MTGIVVPDNGTIGSASDTDAISISSTGIITQSALPQFSADGSQDATTAVANDARIPFNQATSNIGSHFSTSNYWFLTPVAGTYIFEVSIYVYSSGSNNYDFEIISTDTSDSNAVSLTRINWLSLAAGNFINGHCVQYVPASRRISVFNKVGGERNVYLGNNGRHTRFSGSLIG